MRKVNCFQENFDEKKSNGFVRLGLDETFYLVKVMRVRLNEEVRLLNGKGAIWNCIVREIDRSGAILELGQKKVFEKSNWRISLIQCLPKNKALDSVIRKATELGVHSFVPISSQHSEVSLESFRKDLKLERLKAISMDACKQSGNPFFPIIEPVQELENHLSYSLKGKRGDTRILLASLSKEAVPIKIAFQKPSKSQDVICLVGPEGDFSPQEYEYLRSIGAQEVNLGPTVLRVETAATVLVSSVLNFL